MSGDGSITRMAKLDTDNYLQWSIEIEHFLRLKGCSGAIAPTEGPSLPQGPAGTSIPETPSELATEAARKEDHAMSFMVLGVKPHHMAIFRRHRTARDAWEALEHEFRSREPGHTMGLRRDLINLRMNRGETMVQYFNRGKTSAWELQALDSTSDDEQLLSSIFMGLPAKYELTATVLVAQPTLTVQHSQVQMQAAEARFTDEWRGERSEPHRDSGNALNVRDGERPRRGNSGRRRNEPSHRDTQCWQRDRTGHIRRNCPTLRNGDTGGAGLAMMACNGGPIPHRDYL